MSRFSQIIDKIADPKTHPLSQVLLKAKVLAYQLKSRKFKSWIESELGGYPNKDSVPEYRVIPTELIGVFHGSFGKCIPNQKLTTTGFPPEFEKAIYYLKNHPIMQNVAEIEHLANANSETFEMPFGIEIVHLFRQYSALRIPDMIMNAGCQTITKYSLVGVLHDIRSRLLDFLLKLQDEVPEIQEDKTQTVTEDVVDQVLSNSVFKDCTIVIGDNATVLRTFGESGSKLAVELEALRKAMREQATNATQDHAIADIGDAIEAAKKEDTKGVLTSLKKAGKWAFGMAEKIGASLAAKALEIALGM